MTEFLLLYLMGLCLIYFHQLYPEAFVLLMLNLSLMAFCFRYFRTVVLRGNKVEVIPMIIFYDYFCFKQEYISFIMVKRILKLL